MQSLFLNESPIYLMQKVLIYLRENDLAPIGGPLGYNYNLKTELNRIGYKGIHFLPSCHNQQGIKLHIKKCLMKFLSKRMGRLINEFLNIKSTYQLLSSKFHHKAQLDLNQYDIVHFHGTYDMFNVRDDLSTYKGKIILTSHSPTLASIERYEELNHILKKIFASLYRKLSVMDEYSFTKADYVLFPCEEAEEPYYNTWEQFSKIKDVRKNHFKYLLTGIQSVHCKNNRKEILSSYSIPLDSIVISYVGRHNAIKGYDILKYIGERILSKYPNVYFLIAGMEGPMQRLHHPRWIEVGWTNDPYSLIASSDIFILPNRETYFDLILLEVLSIGIPIVASATGGNKYFFRFDRKGILLYKTIDEGVKMIESLIETTHSERESLGALNKELFIKYFTSEVFAKNYITLIQGL